MKTTFPLEIITGKGLGISYSSFTQVGRVQPAIALGEAKLECFNNIATGNFIVFDHPICVDEVNFPIKLQYIYNSDTPDARSAWHFSHKQFKTPFTNPAQDKVILIEEDGHETTYTNLKQGRPTWFPQHCGNGRPYLQFSLDLNLWVWFHPVSRITEHYDKKGRLISRFDPLMRETTYQYEGDTNTLIGIKTPSGNHYTFSKNLIENGNYHILLILKTVQASLLIKTWIFDAQNRLTQSIVQDTQDYGSPYCINYTYDVHHYAANKLKQITQSDNTTLKLFFNHEPDDKRLNEVAIGKAGTAISYDFRYAANKRSYLATAQSGVTSAFMVDDDNQLIQFERRCGIQGFEDPPAEITKFTYLSNQIQSITHPNGAVEKFTYHTVEGENLYGLISAHEKPDHSIINYLYDITHFFNKMATFETLPDKSLLVHIDAYEYHMVCEGQNGSDGMALRFTISPEGSVCEYRYDNKGRVSTKRIYLNATYTPLLLPKAPILAKEMELWVQLQDASQVSLTSYLRNEQGQIIEEWIYAAVDKSGEGIHDEQTGFKKISYNVEGTILKTTILQSLGYDPAVTSYTIDALQRPLSIENPLKQKTVYEYDKPIDNTSCSYTVTLPNGRQESMIKNDLGIIINKKSQAKEGNTLLKRETLIQCQITGWSTWIINPSDGLKIFEFYDRLGNLNFTVDAAGVVTGFIKQGTYHYNAIIHYAKTVDPSKLLYANFPNNALLYEVLSSSGLLNDPDNRMELECLDLCDRIRYRVNPKGALEETFFDQFSNIIGTVHYAKALDAKQIAQLKNGETLSLPIDPLQDRCTRHFYNKDNIRIASQDEAGYITEYKTNKAGWILETILYATPKPIDLSISDYIKIRPLPNLERDAHIYEFYNNRGLCEIVVDAEGYVTQKSYLANALIDKTRRFANPLPQSWFNNPYLRPLLPQQSAEDEVIQIAYDLLNRPVKTLHANDDLQELFEYDLQGKEITIITADDAVLLSEKKLINGDNFRANLYKYNPLGQITHKISPLLAEKVFQVERSTSPDKQRSLAILWNNYSTRILYDANGFLVKTITSSADINHLAPQKILPDLAIDTPTYTYYDEALRPYLTITVLAKDRVIITQNTFNHFNEITETRHYAQTEKSFPISYIDKLKGGSVDNELSSILRSIQNTTDPVYIKNYDKNGNCTQEIDPLGYVNFYSYNIFDECYKEELAVNFSGDLIIEKTFENRGLIIQTKQTASEAPICIIKQKFESALKACTEITSPTGQVTTINHDKLGRKIGDKTIIDDQVIQNTLKRNAFGQIVESINPLGHKTITNFNRSKRQQTTTYPISNMKEMTTFNPFQEIIERENALGAKISITHSPTGKEQTITNPLLATKEVFYNLVDAATLSIAANGIETQVIVDGLGEVLETQIDPDHLKITQKFIRNALNLVETEIDVRGTETQFKRDSKGNIVEQIVDPEGLQLITTNEFNANNQIKYFQQGDLTTPNQYDKRIFRDGFGRECGNNIDPNGLVIINRVVLNNLSKSVALINPLNQTTWQIYDALGRKCYEVDPLGAVKHWNYDANSNVISVFTYENRLTDSQKKSITPESTPAFIGRIVEKDNTLDNQMYYFYDTLDRERFTITVLYEKENLSAIVDETIYDLASNPIHKIHYSKTIDAINLATLHLTDIENAVKAIREPAFDSHVWTVFDKNKRPCFTFDEENYIKETRYDVSDKPLVEIYYATPIVNVEKIALLPINEIAKNITLDILQDRYHYYFYDTLGRKTFEILGEGSVLGFQYDEAENLIQTCEYSKTVIIPNDYQAIKTSLKQWKPNPNSDKINQYIFDKNNRCDKRIDPLGFEEKNGWDALGNKRTITDKTHYVWSFEFDRAKREVKKISPEFLITEVVCEEGKLSFKKQSVTQKITQMIHDQSSRVTQTLFAAGTQDERVVNMHFNACDNLTGTLLPNIPIDNGAPIEKVSKPETATSLTTQIIYNSRQRKIALQNEAGDYTFYIRDNIGRLAYVITPDGATTQKIRDTKGQLIQQTRFATPFTLVPNTIPTKNQLDNFFKTHINKEDDRTINYKRDRKGKPILIEEGLVYDYIPNHLNFNKVTTSLNLTCATKITAFNAFGEIIQQITYLNSRDFSQQINGFDRAGNEIFHLANCGKPETKSLFTVSLFTYNSFREKIKQYEYANPLNIALSMHTTFPALEKLLAQHSSNKDRITGSKYNLQGLETATLSYNITRNELMVGASSTQMKSTSYSEVITSITTYNPLGLVITKTFADNSQEFYFYDSMRQIIAKTDVTQTNAGLGANITPLTYKGYNYHGEEVCVTRFKAGTSPLINPAILPKPINPNVACDPTTLQLFDPRGKLSITQTPTGHAKSTTYTSTGKECRQWTLLTNWTNHGNIYQLNAIHIDSKTFVYNRMDLPIQEIVSRNNLQLSVMNTDYTIFGQPESRWTHREDKQDRMKYNNLGYPWFSMPEGIPRASFYNLIGQEVYNADSQQLGLIESLTYKTLPSILSLDTLKVERTEKAREVQGHIYSIAFPSGEVETNSVTMIPLSLCVGNDYKQFGQNSISWPSVAEQTLEADFYLTVLGQPSESAVKLPLITQNGRTGVNLSAFSSDLYTYKIDYYFRFPNTNNREKRAESVGDFYLVNTINTQSLHAVPYYSSENIVTFAGKTEGLSMVEVWQNKVKIGSNLAVLDNQISLQNYPSGEYQFKAIVNQIPQNLSHPITVFTEIAPLNTLPALTYPIDYSLVLETLENHAALTWKIDKKYEKYAVKIVCTYADDKANNHTETSIIAAHAPTTSYEDAHGNTLLSNFDFKNPVQMVLRLSAYLQIENLSLPLYDDAETFLVQPAPLNIIHTYPYKVKKIALLSPVSNITQPTNITYLNTNLGTHSIPVTIQPLLIMENEIFFDIDHFPLGTYPLTITNNNISDTSQTLYVTNNSHCFSNIFGAQPENTKYISHPNFRFKHDRWGNQIEQTDAMQNTTFFSFNDVNAQITKLFPPVNVYDAHGNISPNFKSEIHYGFDLCNHPIGETWNLSNGTYKTEGWVWDAAHPIKHLLADGSPVRVHIWNSLNLIEEEWDERGNKWLSEHNLDGNLTCHTSPNKLSNRWRFNERGEIIATTNGALETWHNTRDAWGNIYESYQPLGNKTVLLYDLNKQVLNQQNPGEANALSWIRDFYGRALYHRDLGQGLTTFNYDGKKQLIERKRGGGVEFKFVIPKVMASPLPFDHGRTILYVPEYVSSNSLAYNQHLIYSYSLGKLSSVTDLVKQLATEYSVNLLGQTQGVKLYNTATRELLRAQESRLDALGGEIYASDGMATCVTGFDDERNRRFVQLILPNTTGGTFSESTYWDYNAIGLITVCGDLVNGQIQPSTEKGFWLTYEKGLRRTERKLAPFIGTVTATLEHDNDGLLKKTTYSTGDVNDRTYDNAGRLTVFAHTRNGFTQSSLITTYNPNGKTLTQSHYKDSTTSNSKFTYDVFSGILNSHQTIVSGSQSSTQNTTYQYLDRENKEIKSITTTITANNRTATALCSLYQDANGAMNAVIGAMGSNPYTQKTFPENRYFNTTFDNQVIERIITQVNYLNYKGTRYFHTISGQPIASVGYMRDDFFKPKNLRPWTQFLKASAQTQNKSLFFSSNKARFERPNLYAPRTYSFADPALEQKVETNIAPIPKLSRSNRLTLQGIYGDNNYLGSGMTTYTVSAFDKNYEEIAKQIFGDADLGSSISLVNGGQALTPGQIIQIPQLMSSRNTADTSIPYQLLMNIIEGSITPFVKFDTPKRHRSFLKQIIRLIAIGVAVFLAGPTGGLSLGIAATNALGFAAAGIGELIITGVVAGLIDAAEQGLLIGLGVIQKFSFTEVICAGFAAATPGIIGNSKGLEATLRLGASNVAEQLTLMALGKQNHIDLIQVSAALLGATLDPQISKLTNPQDPILKTIQKTLSSAAINAGIKGKFDLELVAAQLISNSVLTLVEPKLMQAKIWANEKVFHPDNPKQLSQPMKTPTKSLAKHHPNASKENVGLAEVIHTKKAMNPESFMKKMGIDEVMEDYEQAKVGFEASKKPKSIIPAMHENSNHEYKFDLLKDLANYGKSVVSKTADEVSTSIQDISEKLHLQEFSQIPFPKILYGQPTLPLSERIGRALPGTKHGSEAVQLWSQKEQETGNHLYAIPKFFAARWTPQNAVDTLLFFTPVAVFKGVSTLYEAGRGVSGIGLFANKSTAIKAGIIKHGINGTMGGISAYTSSIVTADKHPWRNAAIGTLFGIGLGLKMPLTKKTAMNVGGIAGGASSFLSQSIDRINEDKIPISFTKIAINAYTGTLVAGLTYGMPIISATIVAFGPETVMNKLGEVAYEHWNKL